MSHLSVILSAHLQSICFQSPSNSSLEAFSASLCCSLFLFAVPPLIAITCSILPSFRSMPFHPNSPQILFSLLSPAHLPAFPTLPYLCRSDQFLFTSSTPLIFCPFHLLSSSIISLSSRPHSLPINLSTFILLYIPQPECFSLSIILFFSEIFHPSCALCLTWYLVGCFLDFLGMNSSPGRG